MNSTTWLPSPSLGAVALVVAAGLLAGVVVPVQAENVRSCKQGNVEYLVGGAAETACPSADDGAVPSATTRRKARSTAGEPVVSDEGERRSNMVKPDDQGRREILDQELDAERRAIVRLSTAKREDPVEQSQQMARHRANVTALEAEIRRLK